MGRNVPQTVVWSIDAEQKRFTEAATMGFSLE